MFKNITNLRSLVTLASFGFIATAGLFFASAKKVEAASFSLSPTTGTYSVGSTFDVSLILNTEGQSVNTIQVEFIFPADKLQLVSPSTGISIISVYTTAPKFDNVTGKVEIIGGIPDGINVPNGLITKLTFRVKGVGNATLQFAGQSQALLNDGHGTNALYNTSGASYKLELPPQQGPLVSSDTHPDQELWYKNTNVSLQWDIGLPAADNYSFTISDNPSDIPDDVPESNATTTSYKQAPEGINYFHIKAFRDGRWGGVSHYSLKIDSSLPAEFKLDIAPNARTFITNPFIQFNSSDTLSGLDRYEIKIIALKIEGRDKANTGNQLFVDAQSPYQTSDLLQGSYNVIVRAYDKAGNFREVNHKLEITNSVFWFLSQDGISLPFGKQVSWAVVIPVSLFVILLLLVIAYFIRRWYRILHHQVISNHLPETITDQLVELQNYRSKYGKIVAVLFAAIIIGFNIAVPARAQNNAFQNSNSESTPPVITSYSANIKDDELFYVSGRTTEPESQVVVHLQSLVDGGAFDFSTQSDKRGDWTYRHSSFLAGGKYIVWAHTKIGEQLSTPSPQVELDVKPIALNWGNSRITYQSLYIGMITALGFITFALLIYILAHAILVRRRRRLFAQNLHMAEESIKRGFYALRNDIEAELQIVKQAQLTEQLSGEQKVRAEQLRQDLKNIEDIVGREVWQVENFEHLPPAV